MCVGRFTFDNGRFRNEIASYRAGYLPEERRVKIAQETRDIYAPMMKRWKQKEPTDRNQLLFARLSMLVIGVLGTWVALYIPKFGGAFSFALEFYSLTAAFMMPVGALRIARGTG